MAVHDMARGYVLTKNDLQQVLLALQEQGIADVSRVIDQRFMVVQELQRQQGSRMLFVGQAQYQGDHVHFVFDPQRLTHAQAHHWAMFRR